ncbi:hypothetical protein IQ230_13855 [Gloeocapsopsis crepidinum LEGE 06123]|uniref:Uncharacterized protein n=1 Tax=Gloeocapsopsis crepidinum LEGE 06123 TaxID=588587 RepID=A0ABR9UT15_9CHRO|nr:hypothetical protein [Gloeocapsopsis crepidinum]MBE9191411.1 hypothetical protein [Gloeocapsopsis crepidinum LEGE 06123]
MSYTDDYITAEDCTNTARSLFDQQNTKDAVLCLIVALEKEGKQVNAISVYQKCLDLKIEVKFGKIVNAFFELIENNEIAQLKW